MPLGTHSALTRAKKKLEPHENQKQPLLLIVNLFPGALLTNTRRTSGSGARGSACGGDCLFGLWICPRCFLLGSSNGVCLIHGWVEVVNPRPRACCVDGVRVLNVPRVTKPRDNVLPLYGRDGILPRESMRQERFVNEVSRVSLLIVAPE